MSRRGNEHETEVNAEIRPESAEIGVDLRKLLIDVRVPHRGQRVADGDGSRSEGQRHVAGVLDGEADHCGQAWLVGGRQRVGREPAHVRRFVVAH